MITAEQIPPEVAEAAATGLCLAQGYDWDRHPDFHPAWRKEARAAIAAAIAAWPGMRAMGADDSVIYLPLPQEAGND